VILRLGDPDIILDKDHEPNLTGFPNDSVAEIIFNGHEGNDRFRPPEPEIDEYGILYDPVVKPTATMPGSRIGFWGNAGNDILEGGGYPELFYGGADGDTARGRAGNDMLFGGIGSDTLEGEDGIDYLSGGFDADTLKGGDHSDEIWGGAGNDYISGGPYGDGLYAGAGSDLIEGDDGDDSIAGGDGGDVIKGGTGWDTISTGWSGASYVDDPDEDYPPAGAGFFEIVRGGDDNDDIDAVSATGPVFIDGEDGLDSIRGGPFQDQIHGGLISDFIYGGHQADLIFGDGGIDWIWGGDGDDLLWGGDGADNIWGDGDKDTFHGGADNDIIWSGNATLVPVDQPYNGVGPPFAWPFPDMMGAGEGGCNSVDGHEEPEGCGAGSGGGSPEPPGGGAPEASDSSQSITTGEGLLIVSAPGLLESSLWADGVQLFTQANHGTAQVNADGSFTYTPNANFDGVDSFQYVARNAQGEESQPATVTIYVLNNEPAPAADTFSVASGGATMPVSIGVLGNDIWADQAQIVTPMDPEQGSISFNQADGTFTYTPPSATFTGTATFQYEAINTETEHESDPVTVTINVVNTPPQANIDEFWLFKDTGPLNVAAQGVLANDQWANAAQLQAGPASGTLALNADGSFNYTPVAGFEGTVGFTYRAVNSGTGQHSSNVVWIHVGDFIPVAVNDTYQATGGVQLYVSEPGVLENDEWADMAERVTGTGPSHGTLTFHDDGSFYYFPSAGFYGTDSFSYRAFNYITDQWSPAATVTINVGYPEPPVAVDDEYSTAQGISITDGDVLANDVHGHSAELVEGPINGSLAFYPTGLFAYHPNPEFVGDDSFTYCIPYVSETGPQCATGVVTIHVEDVSPAAADDEFTGEWPGVSGYVLGNDQNADSVALVSGPSSGSVSLDPNGCFDYSPNGPVGEDSFQYVAINSTTSQQSAPATVTIVVNSTHDPEAYNDEYWVECGGTLQGNLLPNDMWANAAELEGNGVWNAASFTFNSDGSFTYTASACEVGYTDNFDYRAVNSIDGRQSGYASVTIIVGQYDPLTLDRPAIQSDAATIQMAQLALIAEEAVRRWRDAGVSNDVLEARLAGLQFVITDLPGSHIGGSLPGRILIDVNAAGYGWFVDATPRADSEFQPLSGGRELRANHDSRAFELADLLTTVMHEIGHQLGLEHAADDGSGNIMTATIGLGIRRLPTQKDTLMVDLVFAAWQAERRRR
jgi:hypothetical protein